MAETEAETDYSDYLQHSSIVVNTLALFSGFTVTIITVLITLSNPKTMLTQVALFFLDFLLLVFLLQIADYTLNLMFFCRNIPRQTRRMRLANLVTFVCQSVWGIVVILMFLASELIYLALASAIVYVIGMIFLWVAILRPFMKRRRLFRQKTEPKPT